MITDLWAIVFDYAWGSTTEGVLPIEVVQDIYSCACAQDTIPTDFLRCLVWSYKEHANQQYNPYRKGLPYTPTWRNNVSTNVDIWCTTFIRRLSHAISNEGLMRMKTYRAHVNRWTDELLKGAVGGWSKYYEKILKRIRPRDVCDPWRYSPLFWDRVNQSSSLPRSFPFCGAWPRARASPSVLTKSN